MEKFPSYYTEVYTIVSLIPSGKVASYGQIAKLSSRPRAARQVGYAMAALSEAAGVPWHRVVNSRGEISSRQVVEYENVQRTLLEQEGIEFGLHGRINLQVYGWEPI
jgi:methylated-DNA-protein-cysteine methyltransferase-like protein